MLYQWKAGTRFPAPAQAVGERLAELGEAHGGHVTPAIVVDDARADDSPIHPCLTWDDEEAARMHREDEARRLIRSVYVVHRDEDGIDRPALGYVHVHLEDDGPCYVTTARAMSDADLAAQTIDDAYAGLQGWIRRHEHLQELGPLLAAVRAAVERHERQLARRGRRELQPNP